MQGSLRDAAPAGLTLIETLRWEPGVGALRQARHIARLDAGCAVLGIARVPGEAEALLAAVTGDAPLRLRLTVDLAGQAVLVQAPLPPAKALWRVGIAAERVRSDDPWRGIKSTERGLYDAARAALPEGIDEVIFLNENGDLAEGTISNIFLEREGVLLTPPLGAGVLPGVLRAELLETGRAREAVLRPRDLGRGRLYLGNALRGLIAAEMN